MPDCMASQHNLIGAGKLKHTQICANPIFDDLHQLAWHPGFAELLALKLNAGNKRSLFVYFFI